MVNSGILEVIKLGLGSVIFLGIVLLIWNAITGQLPFARTIEIMFHGQIAPLIFWAFIIFIMVFIPEEDRGEKR